MKAGGENTLSTVQVNHISKLFGNFRAVDALSFEVNSGEIFALLGPNGAGKSTTIRMILDIIQPDSGTINVFGKKITDKSKDRIGYLPEERGLYRGVKVIEVMVYLGVLKGMTTADAKSSAMNLLSKLELADHAESKVSELSKGMQQKVQLAVTVMHSPDLIIIDEPFSGLDPVNRLVVKDMLMGFREQGGAIIMSTHQMNQVEEMADRMLMINRGQQQLYGRVDDIRSEYALHAIIVEGKGDWMSIPGVLRVDPVNNGRNGHILYLDEHTTSDQVLANIAQDATKQINRFEHAVPSLDEIFVRVVEGEAK